MHRVDTKRVAKEWFVSRRTAQNWVKAGLPVDRPMEMANRILTDGLGNQRTLSRAHELIARHEGLLPDSEKADKGDKIADTASTGEIESTVRLGEVGAADISLEEMKSYCWAKSMECTQMAVPDLGGITYWQDRASKFEKSIRDADLHAKKMGLAEGQIISREEFERLLFALAFWMHRGIDADVRGLAPKLVKLDFPTEAVAVLDRFFVRSRFFSAFTKSITQESGVSLPVWAFECLEWAVNRFWQTDSGDPDDVAAFDAFKAALKFGKEGFVKSA